MKTQKLLALLLPAGILGALLIGLLFPAAGEPDTAPAAVPAGVARIDITPERPIRLCGYGSRKLPSEGIAQRLHAKALAIGGERDDLSVLVTFDAIGVPAWVSKALSDRLREKAGVRRENLAVAASHTHCAPALEGNLPYMFVHGVTPEERSEIKRYTGELLDKLEKVALEAIKNRKPGRLSWTKGTVAFAGNRRVLKEGKWSGFGTQADGPVDHSLPVLRVTDPDGKLRAILVNYACHCTTMGGDFNQVHGDWAGFAQKEIESRHPGAIALIAIGCGGDQNPNPRSQVELSAGHGRTIAEEVDRLLARDGFRLLSSAPVGRYREIDLPLDSPPAREVWGKQVADNARDAHFARAMLERLDRGESLESSVTFPVQTWAFGDDLAMLFLGGEVVVDYARRFYREYDADRFWVNAYSNDVPCYIPSRRLYAEGGYEVDSSMVYYGKPARLDIGTEDRIVAEVKRQVPRGFAKKADGG